MAGEELGYKTLKGMITSLAADSMIDEVRETGARHDEFQAILPAYIRLWLNPNLVEISADPAVYMLSMAGEQSGIKLQWEFATHGGVGTGILIDTVKEWYKPDAFPPMFDEQMRIRLETLGTGQSHQLNYVMYYTIRKYSELEMVQVIAGY